jgi:hypothetical protein
LVGRGHQRLRARCAFGVHRTPALPYSSLSCVTGPQIRRSAAFSGHQIDSNLASSV